jgi:hypothetical protein
MYKRLANPLGYCLGPYAVVLLRNNRVSSSQQVVSYKNTSVKNAVRYVLRSTIFALLVLEYIPIYRCQIHLELSNAYTSCGKIEGQDIFLLIYLRILVRLVTPSE